MRTRMLLAMPAVFTLLTAAAAVGQEGRAVAMEATVLMGNYVADPLVDAFFAPDRIMQHQQAIGLEAQQRAAIVQAMQEAQPRFIELQWQIQPENERLAELVRGEGADLQPILQQLNRVLDLEREIKRVQVEMLLRVRNTLTAEQQTQLSRLPSRRSAATHDIWQLPVAASSLTR